jgi:hypothetical protein
MSWISIILATAAAFTLRIIAVLVFVTGIAVLAVGLTSTFIPNNFVSLGYLLSGVGLSLAIPAGCSMIGLPSRVSATRFTPSVHKQAQPASIILFAMTALALLLMTQFGSLADSWQESIKALDSFGLRNVAGRSQDPLGFSLIPVVALLSIPIWQTLTAASFLFTSLLVLVLRAKTIPRVLGACTLLQLSLVAGCFLISTFLETAGALAETTFGDAQPLISSTVAQWVRARATAAVLIARGLVPFLLGYIGSRLWLYFHPETPAEEPIEELVSLPSPILSREGPALDQDMASAYSVRPVFGSMATFTWMSGGYDVFAGSAAVASKHVFSLRTDRMITHPDRKVVLIINRRGFLSSVRELREPSGQMVAVLQHEENEWYTLDGEGRVIAQTRTTLFQPRYCEFTTFTEGVTVARYIWRQIWFKPELQIEFSSSGTGRLDRRVGIVLATLLERKARISTYQKFGR